MRDRKEFDAVEAVVNRLEGTAAKLEVMAAAFQRDTGTPSPEIIEAALVSVAEEVRTAREALLSLLDGEQE